MPHCLLDNLGTLQFRGLDAQKFLQGQLSNDLQQLTADTLLRAGLHNPQGRTLALLALIGTPGGDVLALLPRDLLPVVAAQLTRYVLRAKVSLSDESQRYRLYGVLGAQELTSAAGQLCRYGANSAERYLLLQDSQQSLLSSPEITQEQWRAFDIAAGLPQVTSAISGQFVAQMLNLDCVDAISFTKGCYTGQEVIARAHYRGRVKRRMQRFATAAPAALTAGDSGKLSDGRSFRVIDAVTRLDGRCEFLAVAPLSVDTPAEESESDAAGVLTAVEALPLPYSLPD